MQITMAADPHGGHRRLMHGAIAGEDVSLRGENFFREGPRGFGKLFQSHLQRAEQPVHAVPQRLVKRPLVIRAERLGGKILVGRIGSEHEVEFVEAIPRNPSGKILRRELKERERARRADKQV